MLLHIHSHFCIENAAIASGRASNPVLRDEKREGGRREVRKGPLLFSAPPISSPDKAHLEKLKGNGDCHVGSSRKEALPSVPGL